MKKQNDDHEIKEKPDLEEVQENTKENDEELNQQLQSEKEMEQEKTNEKERKKNIQYISYDFPFVFEIN